MAGLFYFYSMEEIKQSIKNASQIVITSHKSPDGDAIGSSLAFYHYLKNIEKEVAVVVPDGFPDFLNWMEGSTDIIYFDSQNSKALELIRKADLIFSLDYNGLSRIGEMGESVGESNATKIVIDHHQNPQDFANFYFVDTECCSTSQLIYELIEKFGDKNKITKTMGECLYCGIMTDTGSFRFSSTTSKTHQIIAHLIELGVNGSMIHQMVYDTYSDDRLRLIGYALTNKMEVFFDKETAYISLSKKELVNHNFKKGDTEGLVNYPLSINGIKRAILITEKNDGIRFSFRSKDDVFVNQLAHDHFNGGGHIYAAGGNLNCSLNDAILKLKDILNLS